PSLVSIPPTLSSGFSLSPSGDARDLHSFPTRRSSDLCRLDREHGERRAIRAGGEVPGAAVLDRRAGQVPHVAVHHFQDAGGRAGDRKSTRLNSSHLGISYAVFCLKKKNKKQRSPLITV